MDRIQRLGRQGQLLADGRHRPCGRAARSTSIAVRHSVPKAVRFGTPMVIGSWSSEPGVLQYTKAPDGSAHCSEALHRHRPRLERMLCLLQGVDAVWETT